MHPAKGLKAWDAADELADQIRAAVAKFPRGRSFGIGDQLIRAADSIAANLSEGSGRKSAADQVRFYTTALASSREVVNHLKRARGARLIEERIYHRLLNRTNVTHAMIAALIRRLEAVRV